jgi:hypothetical protein
MNLDRRDGTFSLESQIEDGMFSPYAKNPSLGKDNRTQNTQEHLANTQAELAVTVNPIKVFFEHGDGTAAQQFEKMSLDLSTIIYDKLAEYFNKRNDTLQQQIQALNNKVDKNNGKPNPPSLKSQIEDGMFSPYAKNPSTARDLAIPSPGP